MTNVALLNASYEPLGGISFKQAVRMLVREIAVVEVQDGERTFGPYPWPRVIRLIRYVAAKWLYEPAGYSKRGIMVRDRSTCGYCGRHATTIDHLTPRSKGGQNSWLNCVAACTSCNRRKADRSMRASGMTLHFAKPHVPLLIDLFRAAL